MLLMGRSRLAAILTNSASEATFTMAMLSALESISSAANVSDRTVSVDMPTRFGERHGIRPAKKRKVQHIARIFR